MSRNTHDPFSPKAHSYDPPFETPADEGAETAETFIHTRGPQEGQPVEPEPAPESPEKPAKPRRTRKPRRPSRPSLEEALARLDGKA